MFEELSCELDSALQEASWKCDFMFLYYMKIFSLEGQKRLLHLSTLTSFNTAQISLDISAPLREPLNYHLMA